MFIFIASPAILPAMLAPIIPLAIPPPLSGLTCLAASPTSAIPGAEILSSVIALGTPPAIVVKTDASG